MSDDSILKAEEEIAKELVIAQSEYNKLTTYRPVPRLRKPSVYIPCKQVKMLEKIAKVDEEIEQKEEESKKAIRGESKQMSGHEINVAVEVNFATKYDETSGKAVKKVCECTVKFKDKRLREESPKIEEIMPVRNRGDFCHQSCDTIDKEAISRDENPETREQKIHLPELQKIDAGKNVTITTTRSPLCKCKYSLNKTFRKQSCNCEKCQKLNNKSFPPLIISGLKQTESEKTVPVIQGVKDEACDCMALYEQRTKRYEEYKARHDMVEEMTSLAQKFILGGVCVSGGKPIFTILGR